MKLSARDCIEEPTAEKKRQPNGFERWWASRPRTKYDKMFDKTIAPVLRREARQQRQSKSK